MGKIVHVKVSRHFGKESSSRLWHTMFCLLMWWFMFIFIYVNISLLSICLGIRPLYLFTPISLLSKKLNFCFWWSIYRKINLYIMVYCVQVLLLLYKMIVSFCYPMNFYYLSKTWNWLTWNVFFRILFWKIFGKFFFSILIGKS